MKLLLDEARRMIKIKSVTRDGNEDLASYVQTLMQARGLKTQLQQVTHSLDEVSKRQFNAIGILGDSLVDRKTRKGLLLNTHLDTVGPGIVESWTETGGNPFEATVKDGKIYGLGTADVKLDFLCKLRAVEKFRDKKLKQPVYLVGTCGEEMGMFGAKYLIKSMALNPKFVVVGEPSDLTVIYAHKCLNIYKVTIGYSQVERDARGFNRRVDFFSFGKSAHSSYPHLGVNAIQRAADFLTKAIDSGFELRFTKMEGGDTVNKVPDRAMAEFYLASHQFEDFKRFYREMLREAGDDKAFKVDFGGVGDAGVRFLPENIFSSMIEVIGFFEGLSHEFEKVKDSTYSPASSTMNLGLMRQRPGGVDLYFDLRLLPDLNPEELEKHIAKGLQTIGAKYPLFNLSATRDRMNPGLNMSMEHDLVKVCKDAMKGAGLDAKFGKKATSTEAAQYFQAGYEAVVFGPGLSQGNSHSPNENNILEQLEKAVAFYEHVIERVCL